MVAQGLGHVGAAHQHSRERAQRVDVLRVVEHPVQLGRDQRDVAPLAGHRGRAGADVVVDRRVGAGTHGAEEHLEAGDVGGREVQQPLSRAAQPAQGGVGGGAHRRPGEPDALGLTGRSGGLHDERLGLIRLGVPGSEQVEDLGGGAAHGSEAAHEVPPYACDNP